MKKYDETKICYNYQKECLTANKCRNCRNRLSKAFPDGRREVSGCKAGFDINAEDKRKCFVCFMEGSPKCSD